MSCLYYVSFLAQTAPLLLRVLRVSCSRFLFDYCHGLGGVICQRLPLSLFLREDCFYCHWESLCFDDDDCWGAYSPSHVKIKGLIFFFIANMAPSSLYKASPPRPETYLFQKQNRPSSYCTLARITLPTNITPSLPRVVHIFNWNLWGSLAFLAQWIGPLPLRCLNWRYHFVDRYTLL